MEYQAMTRATHLPWWNSAKASDQIPEITDDELTRMEGPMPAFLQIERRLEEIGGGDWRGFAFRNAVLTACGWDPTAAVPEDQRQAKLSAYIVAHTMLADLGWRPTANQVRGWLRDIHGGVNVIPGDGPRSWRDSLDALEERTNGLWRVLALAIVLVVFVWLTRELFL
jgi:hypothetical protein